MQSQRKACNKRPAQNSRPTGAPSVHSLDCRRTIKKKPPAPRCLFHGLRSELRLPRSPRRDLAGWRLYNRHAQRPLRYSPDRPGAELRSVLDRMLDPILRQSTPATIRSARDEHRIFKAPRRNQPGACTIAGEIVLSTTVEPCMNNAVCDINSPNVMPIACAADAIDRSRRPKSQAVSKVFYQVEWTRQRQIQWCQYTFRRRQWRPDIFSKLQPLFSHCPREPANRDVYR